MAVCEILAVGTELLLGDILNRDAQYLSKQLAQMGITVLRHSTVGDNAQRLAHDLNEALKRSDIVITTGGLGPTKDDLTKEVCCKAMGFELYEDEKIVDKIRSYFESKNMKMTDNNKKQALVPLGAAVFENNHGTAPGIAMERDNKCVILLPGPPKELEPMFEESVRAFLSKYSDGTIISHVVNIIGSGESIIADELDDMLDSVNPTIAPYAKQGECLLRVTAHAQSKAQAEELCSPVLDKIKERLGSIIYGIDAGSIEKRVVELLNEQHKKIACAESCTAGYIPKRITDIAGSSNIFECGIVSYSNDVKMNVLGVSADTLEKYTEFSHETAKEMALGVLKLSKADIAISTTGVAGPGDYNGVLGGTAYIAVATKDFVHSQKVFTAKKNDREYNRFVTSSYALNLARLALEGKIK